jgi:hypothetical protein
LIAQAYAIQHGKFGQHGLIVLVNGQQYIFDFDTTFGM